MRPDSRACDEEHMTGYSALPSRCDGDADITRMKDPGRDGIHRDQQFMPQAKDWLCNRIELDSPRANKTALIREPQMLYESTEAFPKTASACTSDAS